MDGKWKSGWWVMNRVVWKGGRCGWMVDGWMDVWVGDGLWVVGGWRVDSGFCVGDGGWGCVVDGW